MKIETNSVHIRYRELFDLLHQHNRDLFREVLETLTEVAEEFSETSPSFFGGTSQFNIDRGIYWNEEGIQFGFAEVA